MATDIPKAELGEIESDGMVVLKVVSKAGAIVMSMRRIALAIRRNPVATSGMPRAA